MNATDGVVERVEGDYAWVRAQGAGHACGACSRRESCGGGLEPWGLPAGEGRLLKLPNPIHARPGDAVLIRAADGAVWRAVRQAYLAPLAFCLGGALLAKVLGMGEGATVLAALLGLLAGFAALKFRRLDSRAREPILSIEFKYPL